MADITLMTLSLKTTLVAGYAPCPHNERYLLINFTKVCGMHILIYQWIQCKVTPVSQKSPRVIIHQKMTINNYSRNNLSTIDYHCFHLPHVGETITSFHQMRFSSISNEMSTFEKLKQRELQ